MAHLSVAVIGAGPRGLSVCERLVALAPEYKHPVTIHVIDPYAPGPGRVWDTEQSPELLMNTTISEQTIFPDDSCDVSPTNTGPSMREWYLATGGTEDPDTTFCSRALYGEYLADAFARVRENAPDNVTIEVHHAQALRIADPGSPVELSQIVRLSDDTSVTVDSVVLCVGHIPSRLTDERIQLERYATANGLNYCPPSLPAETPVDRVSAGETVIFRGFGLNYFDLQALLTHGRGGTFVPRAPSPDRGGKCEPWELEYVPSGKEPVLAPSSRRGIPYRCKPVTPDHPVKPYALRFFTEDNVTTLSSGKLLHFDDQLWPLILTDLRYAWYAALYRSQPELFLRDPAPLKEALTEAVDRHLARRAGAETQGRVTGRETHEAPALHEVLDSVVPREHQLDLQALLRPLNDKTFESRNQLTAWINGFLEQELRDAYAGPELAPSKAVFAVLWAARSFLKELVADGRVSPASFATEVRGWFESFVSGICDGPPPQRFAELLALSRAGLVTYVGPQVKIDTSDEEPAFIASTPVVKGDITAHNLIDAASPTNHIRLADDELITSMLDRGQLTVATITSDEGTLLPTSGPLVEPATLRTVDSRGRVHPHRYVMSIQLSSLQLGLAIAANPNSNARTLRDAHGIARRIYGLDSDR